ncbi:hypothetical protein [Campylobacter sp. RM12637]|uniref:hypothetical protein n=1 Tax=Campylobacter sp. RM12637 TaxID=2735734 RepID=UPI003014EF60|nr:hypothetical protein [Campylobacter sp. RM12637]
MDKALFSDEFLMSLTPQKKKILDKAYEIYIDYLDYIEAKKVLDRVDNNDEKIYSLEEVKKRYNIK